VEPREDQLVGERAPPLEPRRHRLAALLVAAHVAAHADGPVGKILRFKGGRSALASWARRSQNSLGAPLRASSQKNAEAEQQDAGP